MTRSSITKLAAVSVLMVVLAGLAFGTSTRSAAAQPAGAIGVSASASCGSVTATAFVREANGAPAINWPVTFTSSMGGAGTGVTNGAGVATATFAVPAMATGSLTVSATSGAAFGQTVVGVACAPTNACGYNINCGPVCPAYGCIAPHNNCLPYNNVYYYNRCAPVVTNPCVYYNCAPVVPVVVHHPARINVSANPGVIGCGGAASVAINVTNNVGIPLNTTVSLTTSLGSITPTVVTSGGNAVATLNTAPGTSGIALITARTGGISNITNVTVTCVQQQQQVVVFQPAPAQTAPQQVVVTRPAPAQPQVVVTRPAPAQPQAVVTRPAPAQPRPQAAPPRTPPFAAPRTGDAGLLEAFFENDDAANAALIDAYTRLGDAAFEATAVDSSAAIDGEAEVDASASDVTNDLEVVDLDARLVDPNLIGDMEANASLAVALANQDEGSN